METLQADTEPVEPLAGTTLMHAELGIETTLDPEESLVVFDEQSACLTPVGGQDDISCTEGLPMQARGPPADSCDASSTLSATAHTEEGQPTTLVDEEIVPALAAPIAPDLPGLVLVDPDISNWRGQIIYLDFDGEQNVTYNGPVTVGPFDVPAFQAAGELAGREQATIDLILSNLQDIFAGSGILCSRSGPRRR